MKLPPNEDSQIERLASEWITRQGGPWDDADQRALSAWLEADSRHSEVYERMAKTWAIFDRGERSGLKAALVARLKSRAKLRRQRRLAVAASLAILMGGWWMMSRNAPPERHLSPEFEMVLQQIRKLPDGSIVELRDGAEIETAYEAGVRRVRLVRGEAHFRVEKDPDRPFVVQARDLEIRAVGTAFAIQLERASVEVVVTEGRVAVDPVDEQVAAGRDAAAVPTVVDAGNRVIFDTIGLVPRARAIEPMTNDAIRDRLAWRPSRLEFNGLELAEALELLNRTNRLQIKVNSPSIGRLRVSGTFHSDNPEGFARIVEATFGLKADVRSPYEIVLRQP